MVSHTIVLALAILAQRATGDETFTLNIREPRVGDRVRVREDESQNSRDALDTGNLRDRKSTGRRRTATYVEEVLAIGEAGDRKPTRLKRSYEKFGLVIEDVSQTDELSGKTVVIEKQAGKYTFQFENGDPVTSAAAAELDREFNGPGTVITFTNLFPGKPVKVGERWELDKTRVLTDLKKTTGIEFDPDKVTVTAVLKWVSEVEKKRFGEVVVVVRGGIAESDQPTKMKRNCEMALEFKAIVCLEAGDPTAIVVASASFSDITTIAREVRIVNIDASRFLYRELLPRK